MTVQLLLVPYENQMQIVVTLQQIISLTCVLSDLYSSRIVHAMITKRINMPIISHHNTVKSLQQTK